MIIKNHHFWLKIKEEDLMKSIEYLLKAYGMAKESKC